MPLQLIIHARLVKSILSYGDKIIVSDEKESIYRARRCHSQLRRAINVPVLA